MAVDFSDTRELKERVVKINRVAKVVKGGRRFSFTALVVVGDEVDHVGVGYGKANEVPSAITKAVEDAKKNMFQMPKYGTTITHQVVGRYGAARVMLRPRREGTGVIAGAGVRAVLELGGVRDILAKSLGTANPINMVKATVVALQSLRRPEDVAKLRGKQISEVLPLSALAITEAKERAAELAAAPPAPAPVAAAPVVVEEEAPAAAPVVEEPVDSSKSPSPKSRGSRASSRRGARRRREAEAPHPPPEEDGGVGHGTRQDHAGQESDRPD